MEKEAIDYPCTLITEDVSRMKLNKRVHSASLSVKEVLKSPRLAEQSAFKTQSCVFIPVKERLIRRQRPLFTVIDFES
jgi:predicted ATP-grasp superfamily ATP-dependent carboligase